MRLDSWKRPTLMALASTILLIGSERLSLAEGNQPSLLDRIFGLGGGSSESSDMAPGPSALPPIDTMTGPPSIPSNASTAPESRIVPQPRVSKPPTTADPLLTRISIGRSQDGTRFGTFLFIYEDGTVLDSQGIHRADPRTLRPIYEAIRACDGFHRQGHCGSPPTDYLELVQVILYERSFGRLKANAFSYTGNFQGCDPGVRQLQAALDGFQARLERPAHPAAQPPPLVPEDGEQPPVSTPAFVPSTPTTSNPTLPPSNLPLTAPSQP